jgi:hypothetical protein
VNQTSTVELARAMEPCGALAVSVVGNVVTLTWDHYNIVLPDSVFDQYGLPLAKGTPLNRRTIIQTTPPSRARSTG